MDQKNRQQLLHSNRIASDRLTTLLANNSPSGLENRAEIQSFELRVPPSIRGLTVVVTPNEVAATHGTGILIHRLLRDVANVLVVRSTQGYDGSCLFRGLDFVLPPGGLSREQAFQIALRWFTSGQIERIICIPFFEQELQLSIALKQTYKIPLILYVMDDNCLLDENISRQLMSEAIAASDLRLAISPEMQNAYQDAFRRKFWILPPLQDPVLISTTIGRRHHEPLSQRGIIVGNIWHQSYLDLLQAAMRASGVEIDWYCNTRSPYWLDIDLERLSASGIFVHNALSEPQLVPILRRRAFALVPIGTLDGRDPRPSLGRLSLPSRIPFIAATSGIPIIIVGSEASAAAAFVHNFRLGRTADYSRSSLRAAVEYVTRPGFREESRKGIEMIVNAFSAAGMSDWVFRAAETGLPPDERFEALMNYRRKEFGYYVSAPAPAHVLFDFREAYESLYRLRSRGLRVDFVMDVGSSTGVWSSTISELFPDARYLLIDPLLGRYGKEAVEAHVRRIKRCELLETAVSNFDGELEIEVSDNLYGSSFISLGPNAASGHKLQVPVVTLDRIVEERKVTGRGLLKIDVQHAEHLVIEGATVLLTNAVDCVVVELSIARPHLEIRSLMEMATRIEALGFQWVDNAGEWRSTTDGRLEQLDLVFLRNSFESKSMTPSEVG